MTNRNDNSRGDNYVVISQTEYDSLTDKKQNDILSKGMCEILIETENAKAFEAFINRKIVTLKYKLGNGHYMWREQEIYCHIKALWEIIDDLHILPDTMQKFYQKQEEEKQKKHA